MPKYDRFANILEMRIRKGDYVLRNFPTEQQLADEIGASRMTARRALLALMEKGLLVRKPHGKIEVNRDHESAGSKLRLAFLAPAYSSQVVETWRFALDRAADRYDADVRTVDFVHWDDPVIPQTLSGFDGVFLVPSSENIPATVLQRFNKANNLIALDVDLTAHGIPSVQLMPPLFVSRVGDHLFELGHRHIDCLNTQPHDTVVQQRIGQWQLWQRMKKVQGRLIDEPVEPFQNAALHARSVMAKILKKKDFSATAVVCITGIVALGAIRALHDAGYAIGKDVSVAAVDGSGMEGLYVPSHTVLKLPDPEPYLETCIEWLQRAEDSWVGPLLVQPASVELFVGESTGKAPRA